MDSYIKFLYNTWFGRIILKVVTSRTYSKLNALYLKSRLSKHKINQYIEKYNIDLCEYEEKEYSSFNDFFVRKIKAENRPIDIKSENLIAVADSKLLVYEINDNLELHIKNSIYDIKDLIRNENLAKEYSGGLCLVHRLTVDDYHRYCYLGNGTAEKSVKIKGVLHVVRPIATNRYKVYAQNSREYTVLHTENFGDVIQIEIGAFIVGKINNYNSDQYIKGEEKGYFEFGGSTIVLLLKKGIAEIDKKIIDDSKNDIETKVQIGEKIGVKIC